MIQFVSFCQKILETRKSTSDASCRDNVQSDFPRGTLLKKMVPSDNSCLFTSIYFLVNGKLYLLQDDQNLVTNKFFKANSSISLCSIERTLLYEMGYIFLYFDCQSSFWFYIILIVLE